MKKVSFVLIIVLLFNFIFCNLVYADNSSGTFNASSLHQADEEGTVEVGGHTKEISVSQSVIGAVLGSLMGAVLPIVDIASLVVTALVVEGGFYRIDNNFGINSDGVMKVSSIIFGELLLLEPGITKTGENLNPGAPRSELGLIFDDVKNYGVSAFELLRYIAIVIFLVCLLYNVIRIAWADTAAQVAKFKALALDWFLGLIFVIFVKYVFLLFDVVIDVVMESLWVIKLNLESKSYSSFEYEIFHGFSDMLSELGGMQFFAYGLLYICMLVTAIKFFFKYLFRVFGLLFLVVISPMTGVLYTLQRGGDSDKNAIAQWSASYVTLSILQPMQAIIYLIFMFTANDIAINAPFLGIAFLWALGRAEKIAKAILGINDKVMTVKK